MHEVNKVGRLGEGAASQGNSTCSYRNQGRGTKMRLAINFIKSDEIVSTDGSRWKLSYVLVRVFLD